MNGKFKIDSIVRGLTAHKNKWMAAGLMLVMTAGPIAASFLYAPQPAQPVNLAEEAVVVPESQWESAAETTTAPETTAAEEEYFPTPGELNLAHFFPEGADQSKVTESLAGKAFKELMTHDETWISGIYDMADAAPEQMAKALGKSRSRVLGSYNYKDERHDPKNPDTWTINSFKKVRMTFMNGDGQPVSAYSNVIDIMSMANLYTYFKGVEDYDLFLDYAKKLWDNSHSYTVGMSDIYYCDGCLGADAEEREIAELEAEAQAEEAEAKARTSGESENAGGDGENSTDADNTETGSTEAVHAAAPGLAETAAVTAESSTVIVAGIAQPAAPVAPTEPESTVPASTAGVIVSGQAAQAAAAAGEAAQSAQPGNDPSLTEEAVMAAAPAQTDAQSASETLPVSTEEAADAQDPSAEAAPEEEQKATPADASIPASSPETAAKKAPSQCPGHVDLIINVRVIGLKENNGLFEKDSVGSKEENIKEGEWPGWNNYTKASARLLSNQDWFDKYGLSLSVISMSNPLSAGEIESYMNQLPLGLSKTRQDLIRFALSSVGKVPYYWGGKPSSSDYSGNSFGILVAPDEKGRILKGLDCSGWINWVYWSVTGNRLPYESTSGLAVCGTKVSRSQLQPGDIVIRTGADAHVIMFLGWTADGKIRCIHESSAGVNNVTVAIRDANWPYYRKLVD